MGDMGFDSCFPQSSHTNYLVFATAVGTLSGACHCRDSARIGLPGVSALR